MKKCPYCAEEIQDEAIVCRFCGRTLTQEPVPPPSRPVQSSQPSQPVKKKSKLWLYALLGIVVVCIGIYAFAQCSGGGGGDGGDTTVYAKNYVQILDGWTCTYEYGYTTFEGTIKNTSNQYSLKYVELRATILKADGTVVNTNTGFIDSDLVASGATSTFSIMVDNPNHNATKCRLAVEDAYFPK